MDVSRLFTYCEVRDKKGELVTEIQDTSALNKNYEIIWKDTREKLSDNMLKNLLNGRDPSLRNHGMAWTEGDKNKIREYMKNRTEPETDYKKLKEILYREKSAIEKAINGMYTKWERHIDLVRFYIDPDTEKCDECGRDYIIGRKWRGDNICRHCYIKEDKQEYIKELWSIIDSIKPYSLPVICTSLFNM